MSRKDSPPGGIGRVVRIEGNDLILATRTRGEVREPRMIWPKWKTREAGEEQLTRHPSPYGSTQPMAHYGPSSPEKRLESAAAVAIKVKPELQLP